MAKSYFAILGVPSSASTDEIKQAYRRLAKEFHPDYFAGGSETFLQVQEAYSVLGDLYKKRKYEQSLRRSSMKRSVVPGPSSEPSPLMPEERSVDMGEISPLRSFHTFTPSLDEVFDWLWKNFSSLDRPKSGRVRNLTLEVPLTTEQAMSGGNARVMVPTRAICPLCHGFGGVGYYECARCAGEGAISGEVPVSIAFPPGLRQDHAVLIPLERFGIRNIQLTVIFRMTDYIV
jgi:DnaJ-class molecular chaperone